MNREQLYAYALKYQGDYNKITSALENNEPYSVTKPVQNHITILDKEYPKRLLELKDPPWVLFYEGDPNLLHKETCAVVGSRVYDAYGEFCTKEVVRYNSRRVIVSGMAKGIDAIAHTYSRHSIGVLGNGLDIVYPLQNASLYERMKKEQLLISEYPQGVRPQKYHFPFRNRIIAALGDFLVVPSCVKQGGSMVSVNAALELGKEVYTVVHPLYDVYGEGCNLLISQGANVIYNKDDLEELAAKKF
ncbi:MAG: DNA-protecting protein DprA [Erysipelotrichaceae bacterium]|nr:DNA-protecting protein DprA [Erysipelotrichaceae bacterium]